MKNLFKFGFLGLALTLAVSACNTQPAATEADDVDVIVNEDTTVINDIDTTVIDTAAIDTNVVN
ncbi:hypothetical protein [Albibacterium sp.]|uniref:hypothetical protein n=1 Tax=Albibacterium sp. TaxID=2952885 RepID=UPI002C1CCA03|nr:hypothetical protein [Albibacterium sp.]HUH18695.1 hypothetical protein [Albibacterium sp.]